MSRDNNKILVIDDDRNFNYMLSTHLQKNHFEVTQAYSGKQGIKLSAEQKPDLVITDMRLPDIDGFEVVHELKERKVKTRVMVLSGFNMPDAEVIKVKQLGACENLVKSERVGDILKKIQTVIKSQKTYNI